MDHAHAGHAPARFRQSDFFAAPLSLARLRKHAADHMPDLDDEGRIDHLVLGLMQERKSLGDIARDLVARFPHRFARWQDALTRVGELSSRYSR